MSVESMNVLREFKKIREVTSDCGVEGSDVKFLAKVAGEYVILTGVVVTIHGNRSRTILTADGKEYRSGNDHVRACAIQGPAKETTQAQKNYETRERFELIKQLQKEGTNSFGTRVAFLVERDGILLSLRGQIYDVYINSYDIMDDTGALYQYVSHKNMARVY